MADNLAILTLDEMKNIRCPVCQSVLTWTNINYNLISNHCDRIFTAMRTNMKSNDSYLWRVVTTYYEIV